MGRKSTKENKNIYQLAREEQGLTREAAESALVFISAEKIEKIESDKVLAKPDEVVRMAEVYKHPELCNYYCTHECPIGEKTVPEVELKDLSQITLEMLATLGSLEKEKARLIEITVDGEITADERADFEKIQAQLSDMEVAIKSLSLWVENAVHTGKIK